MSRVFAYCRVSTLEQNTENQRHEIEAAGFAIRPQRLIEEHISGSVAASERPRFIRLLDRMESGDVLIGHCCKVSDEAAFCLIQRPYISKTLLTRRISPR
ncbi:recombinase family protein, partial [Klebsiella pneumoniae]|uniref:recombinase family protein n=1 Tax=Klebsiella pneumoniae TaxID=573 RepID=UPI00300FDC0F